MAEILKDKKVFGKRYIQVRTETARYDAVVADEWVKIVECNVATNRFSAWKQRSRLVVPHGWKQIPFLLGAIFIVWFTVRFILGFFDIPFFFELLCLYLGGSLVPVAISVPKSKTQAHVPQISKESNRFTSTSAPPLITLINHVPEIIPHLLSENTVRLLVPIIQNFKAVEKASDHIKMEYYRDLVELLNLKSKQEGDGGLSNEDILQANEMMIRAFY